MRRTWVKTVNPATGEKLAKYRVGTPERTIRVAKRVRKAFETKWRKMNVGERAEYVRGLAHVLRSGQREYAGLMTREMGKPISQSLSEIEKCAWTAELYAENAEAWLADELETTDASLSYVAYQPLGVILSVMPWNFPFWQVFRFAIPALVAGNASILRHSNVCPGSSLAVADLFRLAGFPEDVFCSVITDHSTVSRLIASDLIDGVSLTGSVEAGQKIAELAGRNLKKVVLELGGSDPFVVLEDADVERAAEIGANARLISSGQSCIAAKRFIVVEPVAKRFTERFVRERLRRRGWATRWTLRQMSGLS